MTINTIKFSQMTSGGDLANNDTTPGLLSGANVLFNNPWTFLPSGTTAERPAPSDLINYRLRFNTEDQLYEYYDAVLGAWTQLQESAFTAGPFVTYTSSTALPDAFNLATLANGILKQNITSGVAALNIAVNATDYWAPGDIIILPGLPTEDNQAASKQYVDSVASDISAAPYVTYQSSSELANEFNLGGLTSGLLKQSVTAGISTPAIAVNGTDYWAPGDMITLPGSPTNANDAANKGYVDSVAAGLNPTESCYGRSTANLTGYTYYNGPANDGVGATLTAGSNGAFMADGLTIPQGVRWLYANDTDGSGAYNGIYELTVAGDGSTEAVLTRAANYDTPSNINGSGVVPIQFGTTYAGSAWLNVSTVVTVGVTPIQYVQFGQVSGIVAPANGGTGTSTAPTAGQVLIGTSGGIYLPATISSGTNVLVSSTSGAISIGLTGVISPTLGGTGVSNASGSTMTLNGALNFSGAWTFDQSVQTTASPSFLSVQSTSPTPGDGSLSLTSANNSGNYSNVITNLPTSAARTWSFPDSSGTVALVGQYPSANYVESVVQPGAAVPISNGAPTTIVSITLTPGSYIISANAGFKTGGGTTVGAIVAGISVTNNSIQGTSAGPDMEYPNTTINGLSVGANAWEVIPTGSGYFAPVTTTTYYLVMQANFTGASCIMYGRIWAVQVG